MFRDHRRLFQERLDRERSAAVVPAGSLVYRNADANHRFRPESDFYYLTGFDEPDSILVLVPGPQKASSHLFVPAKNPAEEVWTGRRLGAEAAPAALGVDAAYPIEDFEEELPKLLSGIPRVVYGFGHDEERDRLLVQTAAELKARSRGPTPPCEWVDPSLWLHEQRLVKTEAELENLRRAAALTAKGHLAAMQATRPGVNEREIDALLEYTYRRLGSTGTAYTNIVAGGANACILHYIQNDAPLSDGDLVLIDSGAEWDYYACDVTRTFPVGGTFSPEQRELYGVVLAAQKRAIECVRPGAAVEDLHLAAVAVLCEGLLDLGLLQGSLEEALAEQSYSRFYMHRTGHWLGLDVHDCGAYNRDGSPRPLEPGMVTTVEPGLYVAPDDTTVDERWRGIGIRIEDDVTVTADGHEVLTAAVPKEIDAVEEACASAAPGVLSSK